jgi:hypothetical protein
MNIIRKYYIGYLFVTLGLVSSCSSDFLEENPKGSLTPETFYHSAADLELAQAALALQLNGAFHVVSSVYYGADDITSHRSGNKIDFSDFDVFNSNSSNTRMIDFWNYFYATIKSANGLIKNYPNAIEANEVQRNNAAGHAYFMRAISYFYLTRVWGEVPMPTVVEVSDGQRQNASVQEIYDLIVADLQKAESMLPDHWSGKANQNGVDIYPTKGSAKALLSSVYLTMAGWPLNQTDKYALAAAKAKEVIDNKATWGYELEDNYADIWKIGNKFNHEAVFGCYYNVLVSSWNWENGNMLGPNPFSPIEEGGWEDGFGELSFYERFPEGPRKDATYQEDIFVNHNPNNVITWQQTLTAHPFFLKFRDDDNYDWSTHTANNWWGSSTIFLIRYSDVLLTYAEAKAMSTGPDATAYSAINQVRQRAKGIANDLESGLSATAFRDAVIEERGWEFAGEVGVRWFDLIRTETVGKANLLRDTDEVNLLNQPNDASHTYYWSPIPTIK